MEKVGEDEDKKTIEEASDSVEETRSDKEEERISGTIVDLVDLVDFTQEGFTGPSSSHTVASKDHDFNESDIEDEEKVLEYFRRNSGLISEVTESFTSMNKSEGIILHCQEDNPAETEQTSVIKSPSASDEDSDDSSSNSDLDSSLSRYYFDGSLPVSSHVEESETQQDESPVPKDENQMPLLCPKQPELPPTSWRNCCGLLQLLRAANP